MSPPISIETRQRELQRIVQQFESRMLLARAAELASAGRLLEAQVLLCPNEATPKSADELDLLARIYVKQGRNDLAKRRWEEAMKSGERGAEFVDCLKVLENYQEQLHQEQVYRHKLMLWAIKLALWVIALLFYLWLAYATFSPLVK